MILQKELLRPYIEEYLMQKGLPLRSKFTCLNPDHEDKHPSMSYHRESKSVRCFACGKVYDIFDLVGQDYSLNDFKAKALKVCEIFNISAELPSLYSNTNTAKIALPGKSADTILTTSTLKNELEALKEYAINDYSYFESRGITKQSADKHGFFCTRDKAYMPLFERGACIGYTARSINENANLRYQNARGSMGLWNADYLHTQSTGRRLFVTEGIIDALSLEQMGYCALALCGSQNVNKLLTKCEQEITTTCTWDFILCGDPDASGHEMNNKLASGLEKLGINCFVLELEDGDIDINHLYLKNRPRLERIISQLAPRQEANLQEYSLESVSSAIPQFLSDTQQSASTKAYSTGFMALDKAMDGGIYPGLYVIGAISSLGKTTFALQVGQYIAANFSDVLFFSLEQSRFEIIAKMISSASAKLDFPARKNALTVRQVMNAEYCATTEKRDIVNKASEALALQMQGFFIKEGFADTGIEEIHAGIKEHIISRKKRPVVIVDYLQILKPSDPRASDKQNVDRCVVALKRMSRDFNIPVIAISSFNRENYTAAVSMQAFKESGAVEYSSDVLIGLQLAGTGKKDFDINAAKNQDTRQVELVILKNRNGLPYAKIPLKYIAKYNLFEQ